MFRQRTLTIRRTVQRVNWKHGCREPGPCGRRYAGHCTQRYGGGMVVSKVKSRAGSRTVGLPAELVTVLREHYKTQRREREVAGDMWHVA